MYTSIVKVLINKYYFESYCKSVFCRSWEIVTVSCLYAPKNNRGGCITIIWWLMKVKVINCNLQDNNMLFKKDLNEILSLRALCYG